jgi:O-antigen/teichoic acid export membrane protein
MRSCLRAFGGAVSELKPVLRNAVWLGIGEATLKGGLFVAGVLVARGLGPAAMGAYVFSYNVAMILMVVLAWGQAELLIREVAREPACGRALLRNAHAWQNRVALVVVPLAFAIPLLVPQPLFRLTLLLFVPYAWLRARLITGGALFRGLDRMEVEILGRSLEVVIAACLLVGVVLASGPVWLAGGCFVAGGVVGLGFVAGRLRSAPAGADCEAGLSFFASQGAVFVALALAMQALLRLDTLLLAGLGLPAATIGQYSVGVAPVLGLITAAQVLAGAVYPTVARLARDERLAARHVLAVGLASTGLGLVLAAGLYVVREPAIRLVFGPSYAYATKLLAVLVWALPGECAAMGLGVIAAARRRQSWNLALQVVLLAGAAAGMLATFPRLGAEGVAWTVVVVHSIGLLGAFAVALLAVHAPGKPPASGPGADAS